MSSPTKVAFFGATGGCAGHCLANALNAGLDCVALARTPAKLTKAMKEKGVSSKALDQHLTIIEGNVRDVDAVKGALQLDGSIVDAIVSGIGGVPKLQWSIVRPVVLTDTTICQDAGSTILQALAELQSAKKPTLINVSTTGIPPKGKPRDVPILYSMLYHWLLASPHEDKKVLEQRLAQHVQLPEELRRIEAYVNVKPTLLFDGDSLGLAAVREGVDDQPAVGYTIRRKDVGLWMFERLVRNGVKREWMNRSVSITY
ncbi:hypothetical protein LTR37_016440 [Vermiconidia calcicola]|uniref:Uncharacterized protein n=1 Tax=Vermiconidia calcicola TaxID=1690605 RepID=A0ACC3MMU3_9PEZI|nr:hypothetical protein LTR37_016440 [Vermiconidia calcicola]